MDKKSLEQSTKTPPATESKWYKVIQFILLIVAIPFFCGLIKGLIAEVMNIDKSYSSAFFAGLSTYLVLHLFVFEPAEFFKKTQVFVQYLFGFLAPIFKISYYVVPFWALIMIGAYIGIGKFVDITPYIRYFYFLISFIFIMHLVMVSKIIRNDELNGFFDYMFIMIIVAAINVYFLAGLMKVTDNNVSLQKISQISLETFNSTVNGIYDFVSEKKQELSQKK